MNKIIILLFISGQIMAQNLPIQIYNAGVEILYYSSDSTHIDGVFPISLTNASYQVHYYDEYTHTHFFSSATQIPNSDCGRFDEEINLWIIDKEHYYFSYTDNCEGIAFWKGDDSIPAQFRVPNQLSTKLKW